MSKVSQKQWDAAGDLIEDKIQQLWFDYFEGKCGWSGGIPIWFHEGMQKTLEDIGLRMFGTTEI